MEKQLQNIPVLPLRGMTVFPNMIMHFDIGREKSLKAVEKSMETDEKILVVAQKDPTTDKPTLDDLYQVGTIAHIKQLTKVKEGHIKVVLIGEKRAKIDKAQELTYMCAEVAILEDEYEKTQEKVLEASTKVVGELFEQYAKLNPRISEEMVYGVLSVKDCSELIDVIVGGIPLEVEKKQEILECVEIEQRLYKVIEILNSEIDLLNLQKNIYQKVKLSIDKSQKEYFLREQMKMIQEELGDKDGIKAEVEGYRQKLACLKIKDDTKQKLEKEIDKLLKLSTVSPESGMLRNYIETALNIPWGIETEENLDLKKANKILEKEHYGLEKIKERVLEYIAVRKMSKEAQAPILCLVGPPGVGKTSIAQSIAHATSRNYVRVSLGGVRDEAEIRGHRRTYVGAIPGRFVYGLTEAKSTNPLMLLDEIDKMGGDFRGDPASALLEILDNTQNHCFRDHYLEMPLNLSKVLFVATANTVSTIPKPLLDRMEIIEIASYTRIEKVEIAKKYLLPRQIEKHGLTTKNIKISTSTIQYLIDGYTKEAGVRNLERLFAKLCRKAAKEMIESDKQSISLTKTKIKQYLGKVIFEPRVHTKKSQIGIVCGLAWTSVGGDTLSIEVNVMKGKGNLELTGQMGDVMKESAKAALSYIRGNTTSLNIDEAFYKEYDMHIHIPEGAVPKDGPSAGITMATALISALSKQPVLSTFAMTGEITITGRVLAIGGLKEKLLAAKRDHITDVIVPMKNKGTIQEMEPSIIEGLNILYAETMEDVVKYIFK